MEAAAILAESSSRAGLDAMGCSGRCAHGLRGGLGCELPAGAESRAGEGWSREERGWDGLLLLPCPADRSMKWL